MRSRRKNRACLAERARFHRLNQSPVRQRHAANDNSRQRAPCARATVPEGGHHRIQLQYPAQFATFLTRRTATSARSIIIIELDGIEADCSGLALVPDIGVTFINPYAGYRCQASRQSRRWLVQRRPSLKRKKEAADPLTTPHQQQPPRPQVMPEPANDSSPVQELPTGIELAHIKALSEHSFRVRGCALQ